MGYAKMDQKGNGLHLRTFSRAFIVDDGMERFVFVSVDNAMIGNDIRQEVCLYLYDRMGVTVQMLILDTSGGSFA
jgi:neutral ceramidase